MDRCPLCSGAHQGTCEEYAKAFEQLEKDFKGQLSQSEAWLALIKDYECQV